MCVNNFVTNWSDKLYEMCTESKHMKVFLRTTKRPVV